MAETNLDELAALDALLAKAIDHERFRRLQLLHPIEALPNLRVEPSTISISTLTIPQHKLATAYDDETALMIVEALSFVVRLLRSPALPNLLSLARENARLTAFVRSIAENESDPTEPVADNGGTVWDFVRHQALEIVKPPPLSEADKIELGNILSDALAKAGVK